MSQPPTSQPPESGDSDDSAGSSRPEFEPYPDAAGSSPLGDQPQPGQYGPEQYGSGQYGSDQPTYGEGAPYGPPPSYGQYPQQPYPGQYAGQYGHPAPYPLSQEPPPPPGRPVQLLIGSILAWVGCGLGLVVSIGLLSIASSDDSFEDLDKGALTTAALLLLVLCLVVPILVFFAFRGSLGAAIAVVVIGGLFALIQLYSLVMGNGGAVVGLAWVVASAALILVGAREWKQQRAR
jgi:hypothetical protein